MRLKILKIIIISTTKKNILQNDDDNRHTAIKKIIAVSQELRSFIAASPVIDLNNVRFKDAMLQKQWGITAICCLWQETGGIVFQEMLLRRNIIVRRKGKMRIGDIAPSSLATV